MKWLQIVKDCYHASLSLLSIPVFFFYSVLSSPFPIDHSLNISPRSEPSRDCLVLIDRSFLLINEAWCGVWIWGVEGQCSFLVHSLNVVLIAGPCGFHTCLSVSTQELTHSVSCESPSSQTGLIVCITPCAFVSLAPLVVASALCRLELKT